ncbi:MAG: methyltransferase domain-containing protein [Alphaproteobacteria bacterium]|jgi:SAM-dependent methyltransferase|nr:methyltransferase domain-containing protein [Alphaproteobacteria bacterium]MBN9558768.1 methyltransferase domain-containing protein [Alphaproteobacteria bacterium]MBN9593194.1 methyltransferase domain-containing protein [Alphaproteobacteria bacterium]
MAFDAPKLADFYEGPMGRVVRRTILRRLQPLRPARPVTNALGFGFAVPYLGTLQGEAQRVAAFMPMQQGIVAWPAGRPLTVVGEEFALPFPDEMFDFVLMIHGLEAAEAVRPMMRQVWRVMAPEGRLVIVAPNRNSLWSQFERSPFGWGHPYSRTQLDALLHESMFTPDRWDSALYFPPLRARRYVGTGQGWEKAGRTLWPRFAGVHLVAATKSLFAATPLYVAEPQQAYVRA